MKKTSKNSKRSNSTTRKKSKYFIYALIGALVCAGGAISYKNIRANHVFKIDNRAPACYESAFTFIPDFNDDESAIGFNWFEIFSSDISNMDLSGLGDKIKFMSFDNYARFPSADKMPIGFDPETVLENGKNPGLGIRSLHSHGITGKGITVAIIDNGLKTNCNEIKDNLIHYEVLGKPCLHYHGTMVSSLLCGKTTGVAPDAKLVYFASGVAPAAKDENYSLTNDITALNKILEMNKHLPKDKRISAVSISRGWYKGHKDYEKFKEIVSKLIESGVMVLHVGSEAYNFADKFDLLDRKPNADPDNIESYSFSFVRPSTILVPAGGRTGAGPEGNYMYWGVKDGGNSWAVPYIVGVYALAKQVYPDLMPKEFFEIVRKTGYRLENLYGDYNVIIQPTKIIEYLQNKK